MAHSYIVYARGHGQQMRQELETIAATASLFANIIYSLFDEIINVASSVFFLFH